MFEHKFLFFSVYVFDVLNLNIANIMLPNIIEDVSRRFGKSVPVYRSCGWQGRDDRNCFENAIRFIALILKGMPYRFGDPNNRINWWPYSRSDPRGEKYFSTNKNLSFTN